MTSAFFRYPKAAAFGRVLPKSKIYEHGSPGSAVKELFVRQVEQITWQFKLSPETVNLKGTAGVPEIQVFEVSLRDRALKFEVLRCIDRAIPFPLIFELCHAERFKVVAAYKRPAENDTDRWTFGEYLESEWKPCDTPREPLPMVLDLESLYGYLLDALIPFPSRPGETLPARMERMERMRAKRREIELCEARLRKEKQFNLKVEINAELRQLKQEYEGLLSPLASIEA